MIIALLSAAMVLTACAKNTSDTDSNKANDTKTQDTSKDAAQDDTETEKTKEYQAKLDMIEPSAYGDASGLSLEEGAYISIIGKGTNDDFWVQVKKGAEQAGKDIKCYNWCPIPTGLIELHFACFGVCNRNCQSCRITG